jgi:hypothetical protein
MDRESCLLDDDGSVAMLEFRQVGFARPQQKKNFQTVSSIHAGM